ncbi:TOMM precursor leader peptide-binding protein [Streptomyces sp. NPDC007851]|uniref:TOMM precursor leader peptide-binding protein n=1 Tax=Streptomyces sp. NPDC007851 TaxID=3155008 RepID=UPI0033DB5F03
MYQSSNPRPQRVAGWGQFRVGDSTTVLARDNRRLELRGRGSGLTPNVVAGILEACDGSRVVDDIVARVLDTHPSVSPGAVRRLMDQLAQKHIVVDAAAPVPAGLSADELASYRRHIAYYSEFETETTNRYDYLARLKRAKVVLIGLGGAGSLMAASLASSGVRRIVGIDGDIVEETNLHRQLFYLPEDVDRYKADALAERLTQRLPDLSFTPVSKYVMSGEDLEEHIEGADLVVHMGDFPPRQSRVTTTESCLRAGIPSLHFFNTWCGPLCLPGESACFGCYEQAANQVHTGFEQISASIDAKGPYSSRTRPGVNLWMMGIATSEAVGFLSGTRRPATVDGMIAVDPVAGQSQRVRVQRSPLCRFCGPSAHLRESG